MSVDINTHGRELREVVDSILRGRLSWVIFGYEGNTTTLMVVEKGQNAGDMFEEFVFSRVMYGYARVNDPNTKLEKYVFIYWQGSGAPEREKIACTRHGDVIKQFCTTIHVTIHARSDADLDWDEIMGKVAKASGASYSCHREQVKQSDLDPVQPVGSVYQRIDVKAEIPSAANRLAYWKSQEEQSSPSGQTAKAPVVNSSKYTPARSFSLVKPVCETDDIETDRTRFKAIREARQAEIASAIQARKQLPSNGSTQSPGVQPTGYRKIDPRSEIMLAKQLSQTSMEDDGNTEQKVGTNYQRADPRSEIMAARKAQFELFEGADSDRQVGTNYRRPDVQAEISAARAAAAGMNVNNDREEFRLDSTTNFVAQNHFPHPAAVANTCESTLVQPTEPPPPQITPTPLSVPASSPIAQSPSQRGVNGDQGVVAVCLYDYTASEEDEISFSVGEELVRIEKIDPGWWLGENSAGQRGLFPSNYVELVT